MSLQSLRPIAMSLLVLVLTAARPAAQTQELVPPDEETDIGDVIRAWRHKEAPPPSIAAGDRMIVAAPIIGSNPTAGFLLGVAAQMAVYRGDPSTTRISSGIASLSISSKKQVLFNVRFDSYSDGNRWLVEGDNRFQSTSQNVYGFGTATPASSAVDTDYGFVRVHETVYRRAARDVYVGGGFLFDSHTSVEPADASDPTWPTSPYITYSQQHGLPTDSQQSAGFSVNLLVNRRDNDISARRGWRVDANYRASFGGFLGADSSWQEFDGDARVYLPLDGGGRHRLALWSYASFVTNGVAPYFDVPATVMDTYGRSARGYQEGRYRGEQLAYAEAEYRGTLTRNGLLGAVAFATMTTVSNHETGETLFDSVAPSAGGGLRLLLNKRSRTNLCVDVAWGKAGSNGVYLAIQEAF
jgi:outer membrane protein assembly factor BamA